MKKFERKFSLFNLFIVIQFSMFERSLYSRFIESTGKVFM